MSFGANMQPATAPHLQNRLPCASRWFARTREIVDRLVNWSPITPGRPEQIWFPDESMSGR